MWNQISNSRIYLLIHALDLACLIVQKIKKVACNKQIKKGQPTICAMLSYQQIHEMRLYVCQHLICETTSPILSKSWICMYTESISIWLVLYMKWMIICLLYFINYRHREYCNLSQISLNVSTLQAIARLDRDKT